MIIAALSLFPSRATPVTATTATSVSPVSNRAAATILGAMFVLIVTLMAVLVHATWYASDAMADSPAYQADGIAQR